MTIATFDFFFFFFFYRDCHLPNIYRLVCSFDFNSVLLKINKNLHLHLYSMVFTIAIATQKDSIAAPQTSLLKPLSCRYYRPPLVEGCMVFSFSQLPGHSSQNIIIWKLYIRNLQVASNRPLLWEAGWHVSPQAWSTAKKAAATASSATALRKVGTNF